MLATETSISFLGSQAIPDPASENPWQGRIARLGLFDLYFDKGPVACAVELRRVFFHLDVPHDVGGSGVDRIAPAFHKGQLPLPEDPDVIRVPVFNDLSLAPGLTTISC